MQSEGQSAQPSFSVDDVPVELHSNPMFRKGATIPLTHANSKLMHSSRRHISNAEGPAADEARL